MSWSIRLGRLLGIDVYVHLTFLILLAFILFARYRVSGSAAVAIQETAFVVAIFGIVVLHEYGHALMARRFGVQTKDITLLPIGGVARLERIPENPVQEFLIAIAGPAVNVAIAALCYVLAAGRVFPEEQMNLLEGPLLPRLFMVNVSLVLFNMIPAFPMDGGRVLRSLLAMNMNYVRATQIAAWVGQMFALLMGFAGLFGWFGMGPLLILIAFFVWMGAAQEAAQVAQRSTLGDLRVGHAMMTNFQALHPEETLETVGRHILAGFQQDFPVLVDSKVVGIITRRDLLKAMAQTGRHASVGEVMQKDFATAQPEELLTDVIPRLQACECHAMPVIVGDKLVGLISAENVGELIMLRNADQASRTTI
jgi:Zn-dependent protease/predicted transcriptional regulator